MQGFKHFFTDRPVDSANISIRGLGINEIMPPTIIDRPNGRSDWLFMLFYDPVQIGVSGRIQQHPADTLMIWPPNTPQHYGQTARKWRHTWIHCEGRFVNRIVQQLRLPTGKPIAHANPASAEQHLLAIHDELSGQAQPDAKIVCNLLENWLRQVRRRINRQSQPDVIPRPFLEARQYLDRHYDQPLRLSDLTRRMKLTEQHLCSRFGQYFGISPKNYVIRLRLHHATQLLGDQNLTITQIAQMVGYRDLYHFSKLFKKHMGVSPQQMRRQEKTV